MFLIVVLHSNISQSFSIKITYYKATYTSTAGAAPATVYRADFPSVAASSCNTIPIVEGVKRPFFSLAANCQQETFRFFIQSVVPPYNLNYSILRDGEVTQLCVRLQEGIASKYPLPWIYLIKPLLVVE